MSRVPVSLRLIAAAAVLLLTAPLVAAPQPADDDEPLASVSHPVVEPVAPSAGKALNAALERLARDPRNVEALTNAGSAALTLGDTEAALGFYARAAEIAPQNLAVKVAIAGAQLRLGDPVEALGRYADAERGGADPAGFALDRGLAYALVGDTTSAATQYRLVMARSADAGLRDEAARRLAIALAIAGDRRAADLALLDQLQRQDRAAWRAHVFVLAITGKADDAVALARATLPADLASEIGPYLRFIARLTPAQQAAAASLGRFPRAADIGRDDPRVAAYALAHPHAPGLAVAAPAAPAPAAAEPAADSRSHKHRRGHDSTPQPAPEVRIAAAPADIALPPPPPPPQLAAAPASPAVPAPGAVPDQPRVASGAAAERPATAAGVPQPTVLSRLDLPPAPRAAKPPRTALAANAVPVPPPATIQPVPAPVAPVATPGPPPAHARPKADSAKPAAKSASPKPEAKSAHERKADDSDSALGGPCPPTGKAKAGKAKAAKAGTGKGKSGKARSSKARSGKADKTRAGKHHGRHESEAAAPRHGKGRHKPVAETDDDTCATRGERPDAPTGVSRDSDDDHAAKAKPGKDKKGKTRDKDKDTETGKSGRKARYASRIWVQVLTGADRDRMAGEWRAMVKKARPLKGHKPFITPWRSNFRLLTGPFDSDADAQDFIAQLRKDGVSGFEWTSPAGQAVDSLSLE